MQASQREMQKAASEIASANIPASTQAAPQNPEDAAIPPVNEGTKSEKAGSSIAEPVIELKRQELLFTASATVVSTANKTIGSLLDVKS